MRPCRPDVVVAADVSQRDTEGVTDEREVLGLEIARADDQVDRPEAVARGRRVERRVGLVGDGEDADGPARAIRERGWIRPDEPQPVGHVRSSSRPSRSLRDTVSLASRCSTVRECWPGRRLAQLGPADKAAGVERRLSGLGHAGQDQLRDIRVDVDGAGPARGRHAVVPIGDVEVVAGLDELDWRERLQPVHRAVDPLPAGAPVPAPQPGKRSKVGGVLGRVSHRADDAVDRNGLQPERPARSRAGRWMDVE